MKEITEKTALSITLVISVCALVVWGTQLDSQVRANISRLDKVSERYEEQMQVLMDVKSDVQVIKHILQEKKK